MSGFTNAPFSVVAPLLAEYGYNPVPIKPGGKAPLLYDWQAGHPPSHYPPRCALWGTGILTRSCPAIDFDIRDREVVRVLIRLAGDQLGHTPFRVGAPPKALLPFATAKPFDKLSGRWWALPGDEYRAPGYSPHRVEILGDGQQFVAYARHPRGSFYRWRRYSPMSLPRDGLPSITEREARAFLATAERVLKGVGGTPLKRSGQMWVPDIDPPRARTMRRREPRNWSASDWQQLDPETLAKRIDAPHARRLKDGGWITSCPAHTSTGQRSLSITPRRGGGSVVHCFAECRFPEIARAIEGIVPSQFGRAA